jgi:signal transduction histidine kinase
MDGNEEGCMLNYDRHNLECIQAADDEPPLSAGNLIHRYKMICELGRMVTSEMNLESLFGLVMQQTASIMSSERASVFLYDKGNDLLWSHASTDLKTNAIRISPHCGIAGWVFNSQSALIVNDPYNNPRFFPGVDKKTGSRTRNILCTPLMNRSRQCVGTLQAMNKKGGDFDENDLELLTAASYYVTIALENARLYEDLKALDKAKERAINHLSHEIKTPLSILGGVLRQIEDKAAAGDVSKVDKALRRGDRNVKRLKALQERIDDILQCQKIDSVPTFDVSQAAFQLLEEIFDEEAKRYPEILHRVGERLAAFKKSAEFTAEEIHLATFMKGICERAKAAVDGRKLCLIQALDEDAVIYTDWNVLDKICTGLLKNAIENTPDEGIIEVTVDKHGEETRITFIDHGVGITDANRKMIFGGFFHTQPTHLYSSKKPYDFNAGGTGADLLRIKSFSERLGFKVEFTSRRCPFLPRDRDFCPGKISHCRSIASKAECLSNSGSTFVVSFPASPDSATAEASCV